jgi:hypothetical protein
MTTLTDQGPTTRIGFAGNAPYYDTCDGQGTSMSGVRPASVPG